jgi:hypothetical protein
MTTINDLPQPATQYPFKPDQCVYYMPSPRWKAPLDASGVLARNIYLNVIYASWS